MENVIRIGTCSWKYESWRGLVYPDFGEIEYLTEYSKKYNTVEIDQWFWSLSGKKIVLPNPKVVSEYNNNTPDKFRFTIKAPNSLTLTHHYKSSERNKHFLSTDLMNGFLDSIKLINAKIGMLMFQFEYLNKQKMSGLNEFANKFADFKHSIDSSIPIGIEIRNPNYLNSDYFKFLNDINVSVVFLQGYYMPQISEIYEKYKALISNVAVIRLHGFDRKGIENRTNKIWNSIVDPKDDELLSIVKMLAELNKSGNDIYLNVNNHYEGSAPLTISKIKKLLKSA